MLMPKQTRSADKILHIYTLLIQFDVKDKNIDNTTTNPNAINTIQVHLKPIKRLSIMSSR